MGYRTSKSGLKATIIIYSVLAVVLTVCTFAIPFPKQDDAAWALSYVFAMVVLVAELILTLTQIFQETDDNQKILGLPIVYSGYIALIVQLLATVVFYICNAFIKLPIWIIIVVEVVILGYFAIQIAKGYFFKNRNAEYHVNNANTKFMDEFRARLKAIMAINKIENIERELQDLLDVAAGSDPVTNDKILASESELLSDLVELDETIKNGSEETAREVIEKTKNTLYERNALCKAGKQ